MSQATDYVLSNQSGASFRAELNTMLAAIVSANSGATEPTTTYAYMLWADSSSGILKLRNAANNAWISLLTLSTGAVIAIPDDIVTTAKILDDAVTTAKLAFDTGALGYRNVLINGGMQVDQRNAGVAQTITAAAALAYTVDRWYAYCTGANVTGQQVAGAAQAKNRYRFTGAASVTKIGFAQRIEAANSYHLNNGTATLSVDLANSLLTTVTWTAWYANSADTFGTLGSPTRTQIATGTFTVNSTVTNYSTNITIPSAATTGIEIELSVAAQTSGTWTIGNIQLEAGSVATPFENMSYGTELALCQRYYYRIFPAAVSKSMSAIGWASSTSATSLQIQFPVTMRIAPTALETSGTASQYTIQYTAGGTTACDVVPTYSPASTQFEAVILATVVGTPLAANGTVRLRTDGTTGASAYLGWSAEL